MSSLPKELIAYKTSLIFIKTHSKLLPFAWLCLAVNICVTMEIKLKKYLLSTKGINKCLLEIFKNKIKTGRSYRVLTIYKTQNKMWYGVQTQTIKMITK